VATNTHEVLNTSIPFVVQGTVLEGRADAEATPPGRLWAPVPLDLDSLVWPGHEPTPLFELPTSEIIDFLAEAGKLLRDDAGGFLEAALEGLVTICGASLPVAERAYASLWQMFEADMLRFQVDQELGGSEALDTWTRATLPDGTVAYVRGFPTRMVHVIAGNAPGVAAITVARSALVKGVSLIKMASNDVFTTPAVLQTMAMLGADHPVVRSFSAVYWRGGDTSVESILLRAQFFEKLIVWGGLSAVDSMAKYIGPGIELISFDPKSSISVVGREAFDSPENLSEAAAAAATDATIHNQDACTASRFQFVEGDLVQVDSFCEALVTELGVEREKASSRSNPVPADVREEIDALRTLAPYYRVWGKPDGTGMVVRSDEPVNFYPTGRVVNVVPIMSIHDVLPHVNAATQTLGVYPDHRKSELRDAVCSAGVQRVTTLGHAGTSWLGLPHDGFYPMPRMIRWAKDDE